VQYPRFQKYLQREIFSPDKLMIDYKAFVKSVTVGNVLEGQTVVAEDPDDDAYFRVAKACGAKLIVSGDLHLLKVAKFEDVRVVEPAVFLEIFPQLRDCVFS
jgi:predicted nucleic acid-binding protein